MRKAGFSPVKSWFKAPREQTQMASVLGTYLQWHSRKRLTRCCPGPDPCREDDGRDRNGSRSDGVFQTQQSVTAPSSLDVLRCVCTSITSSNSWCHELRQDGFHSFPGRQSHSLPVGLSICSISSFFFQQ